MSKRIEEKILDILTKTQLNESVPYEDLGGPTPSSVLKTPIDYAKNVKQATVPQTTKVPRVGEIGSDDASSNAKMTDGYVEEAEDEDHDDEDEDKDDKDGKDDKDLEETFASLLARLAEEDDLAEEEFDEDEEAPKETLPDVDSKLDSPDELVTDAPGVKVAEDEDMYESEEFYEDEESLKGDNGGTPKETLPDVDSELDSPEKLAKPAKGTKGANGKTSVDKDDDDEDEKDVSEDIDAIFSGMRLSENARNKAANVFQAAVTRRVNEEKYRVQNVATRKLKEAFAILKSRSDKKQAMLENKMGGQVDRYLNYVVENWMGENRLAVERGIRAELAESFITGLKSLFVEHYIEVPDSKVDVVETLGKKVTKLESKLNEAIESNVKMRASLSTYRKEEVVRAVSSGLADTQREKLKGLAEGVEYTTRKEFADKLLELREAYFPKKATPVKREEQPLFESKRLPTTDMSVYTDTLTRMKKL